MSKKFDLVAVTGKYTTHDGVEKSRFQNVGALIEGEKGPYIVLESWFNPAGVAEPGRPCFLQLYEPRPKAAMTPNQQAVSHAVVEEDAPF